uniref:Uncharacterized protein n=1 Tax=Spongospora subterranea TaxID=70186 RepID=A0A0H5RAT7_9EUKA|eukprot:CRZ10762.1 hypothetical protein [Spongospora subterranea]
MADNIISRLVIGQPQNPGLTMCQRCTPAGTATFTTTVPWNRSGFDHYWPFSLPPLQCPNTNCSSSAPRTMETRPKRARYEQIPHDPISTLSTPSHRIVSVHALFYTFNPVQTQIVLIRSPTRSSFSMPMATISPPSTRTGLLDEILKTVRIALNRSLIPEVVIDQVVDRQRHIPDIFRYDNLAIIIHPINQKQIDLMKSVESLQTCQINVLDVVLPNRSSSTPKLAVTTQAVLGCMELGSYLQFRLAPLTIRHSYVSAIELHPSELLEYEYGAILPSMSRHQRQYVLLEVLILIIIPHNQFVWFQILLININFTVFRGFAGLK